jgi:hypothetical protein
MVLAYTRRSWKYATVPGYVPVAGPTVKEAVAVAFDPFNPPAPVDNSTDNSGSWLSDLSPNTALQGLTTVLGASINKGLFGGTGSGTGGSGKINTTTNTKTVQPSNNTPMVIGLVVLGAVGLGTLAYFVSKKTKK